MKKQKQYNQKQHTCIHIFCFLINSAQFTIKCECLFALRFCSS